jgi:hypothetical protein
MFAVKTRKECDPGEGTLGRQRAKPVHNTDWLSASIDPSGGAWMRLWVDGF